MKPSDTLTVSDNVLASSYGHRGRRNLRNRIKLAAIGAIGAVSMLAMALPTDAQTIPTFGVSANWSTAWSLNPYTSNYAMIDQPLWVLLPLAFQFPSGTWDPQLAQSWKFAGNQLIFTLQPHARWQNGQSVTSTDVVDSYLLGLVAGWSWGSVATNVVAVNSHQVAFSLRSYVPGIHVPVTKSMALADILENEPVMPASEYGSLVTPKLRSEIVTDLTGSKDLAQKAAIYLDTYIRRLDSYNPSKLIGDGPYTFRSITTNQISLRKSATFYDAKNIHIQHVLLWQGDGTALSTAEMFSGTLAWAGNGSSRGIVQRWLSGSGHRYAVIPSLLGEAFYFNDQVYPFNSVKVRQALLYAVNRPDVSIAGMGFHVNTFNKFVTGLTSPVRHRWFGSNTQMLKDGFNPYNYDPSKAKQMLEAVGFTDRHGKWYTPKGQRFTIAITAPEGWGSTVLNAANLASQLNAFGIKTTASSVEQPGYWSNLTNGQFDVAWDWDGWSTRDPLHSLYTMLVASNYIPGTSDRGFGFGPNVNVPGLGTVNLATSLTNYEDLGSPTKIRKIALDYAKMINQNAILIPFDTKDSQTFWNAQYYNDWPPLSNKRLWSLAGDSPQETVPLMMEAGFIRAKS